MKTLNVNLDKLSRKGLKAYITLLEEWDDYKMKEGDEGVDLPLPSQYPEPIPPEQLVYPVPEKPKELKPKDEETSFSV